MDAWMDGWMVMMMMTLSIVSVMMAMQMVTI